MRSSYPHITDEETEGNQELESVDAEVQLLSIRRSRLNSKPVGWTPLWQRGKSAAFFFVDRGGTCSHSRQWKDGKLLMIERERQAWPGWLLGRPSPGIGWLSIFITRRGEVADPVWGLA